MSLAWAAAAKPSRELPGQGQQGVLTEVPDTQGKGMRLVTTQ